MKRVVLSVLLMFTLLLAACTVSEPAPTTESDATTAETTEGEAAEEAAPEGGEEAAGDESIDIVVSMKGPGGGNPFWAAVERGASEKGEELGVNVTVMAPPTESDVAAQISQIEDQLAKGVDAVVIATTDPSALSPVLQQAIDEGTPVVYIDTVGDIEGVTFIGTDNQEGARLAAEYICENVPEGSNVAILQGIITQSTGQARAEGSKAGLEACGLNVVAEQPGNWDRAEGQAVMENILTGNPDLAAVFASNDNMALGAVEALKAAGMLEQVLVVGFDANPDAAQSILAGEMSATVAQNPYNMGALGVENAIKLINGEGIPEIIDTGTVLVTAENAAEFTE
jgi:ribose transport system substrate-binding protein